MERSGEFVGEEENLGISCVVAITGGTRKKLAPLLDTRFLGMVNARVT